MNRLNKQNVQLLLIEDQDKLIFTNSAKPILGIIQMRILSFFIIHFSLRTPSKYEKFVTRQKEVRPYPKARIQNREFRSTNRRRYRASCYFSSLCLLDDPIYRRNRFTFHPSSIHPVEYPIAPIFIRKFYAYKFLLSVLIFFK